MHWCFHLAKERNPSSSFLSPSPVWTQQLGFDTRNWKEVFPWQCMAPDSKNPFKRLCLVFYSRTPHTNTTLIKSLAISMLFLWWYVTQSCQYKKQSILFFFSLIHPLNHVLYMVSRLELNSKKNKNKVCVCVFFKVKFKKLNDK